MRKNRETPPGVSCNTAASQDQSGVSNDTQALIDSAPWWARLTSMRDVARLASAIALQQKRLDHDRQLEKNKDKNTASEPEPKAANAGSVENADQEVCLEAAQRQAALNTGEELLGDAKESLAQGDIDSAWKALLALERETLPLLSGEERKARWVSATREANKKVGDWRGEATDELAEAHKADKVLSLEVLREILFHIHAQSQNTHYKNAQLRAQLRWVAVGVTVLVAATLMLNRYGFFAFLGDKGPQMLELAIFSGLAGGMLSVAFSVVRSDPKRKIPEARASFALLWVRPVVGAAIAVPILFFLESDLIVKEANEWVVLALCFIGGFSERWFLGIVERIEGGS